MEIFKLTDNFYKHIPYTSGVYAIRNDLNNHMYIGSTTNLRRRLRTHIGYLKNDKHTNELLQCDFNKIGIDKFSYIILEHCDENIDTLHYLENKYIQQYAFYNEARVDGAPVHQYDLTGKYIQSFKNLKQAAKFVNGFTDNVRAICDGRKKSYKGYQWAFDKADNIGKIIRYSNCSRTRKAVGQYTVDGILINEYQSKHDASNKCGISAANISNCLHGRSKTAGGFIWKFLDKKINYDK